MAQQLLTTCFNDDDDDVVVVLCQMGKFRTLKQNVHDGGDAMLADNFRPVLALNGRKVYLTYEVNSAQAINSGHLSVAVCLAAVIGALAARY